MDKTGQMTLIKNLTQADTEKPTMGAASGRNYIYIFFSFCSSFEPRGSHRTSSTRKQCHIGQTCSTPPTRFERSTFIEISSTREERTYRRKITDFSNTVGPLGIDRNSNQSRKRIMSKGIQQNTITWLDFPLICYKHRFIFI